MLVRQIRWSSRTIFERFWHNERDAKRKLQALVSRSSKWINVSSLVWPSLLEGAREALLLARSIRTFAAGMADNPIWVLVPEAGSKLASKIEAEFRSLNVRLIPFALSEEARAFPFAAKPFAAAQAEALAKDETPFLIWLDRDSIVIQEPQELRLPQKKVLGYLPLRHFLR
jgi:hypothetical protein